MNQLKTASIVQGLFGGYSGLTFAQLAKPQYQTPTSIAVYDQVANQLIMGTGGTPTTPLLIDQGAGGTLDGTTGSKPGIGPGDGVMIAGDVRTLAREYCSRGHRAVQPVHKPGPHRDHAGVDRQRLRVALDALPRAAGTERLLQHRPGQLARPDPGPGLTATAPSRRTGALPPTGLPAGPAGLTGRQGRWPPGSRSRHLGIKSGISGLSPLTRIR